ncbi:UNVERIFIED_ORG: DNA-binding response OmpR family regulator [Variovorax paradoxus]|jgi:DNA-binding response OmpR family regulator|nr:DNA-binding response OmpR family regulator [Variovorax paradoxus]
MITYKSQIHYRSLGLGGKSRGAFLTDCDDDAVALTRLMHQEGHELFVARSSPELLNLALRENFDFLILDWDLSDSKGRRILGEIRIRHPATLPILILATQSEEMEIVQALELGANDYMVKPWRPHELMARIKVITRPVLAGLADPIEKLHGFELNKIDLTFTRGAHRAKLTMKEFLLARTLLKYLGLPVSRDYLFKSIWHDEAPMGRTVDTHIYRVRQKLHLNASHGFRLKALHGSGYQLDLLTKSSGSE